MECVVKFKQKYTHFDSERKAQYSIGIYPSEEDDETFSYQPLNLLIFLTHSHPWEVSSFLLLNLMLSYEQVWSSVFLFYCLWAYWICHIFSLSLFIEENIARLLMSIPLSF
jgi:hypothetical protein